MAEARKGPQQLREAGEFWLIRGLVALLGVLPLAASRSLGGAVGALAYFALPRLRRTGARNLLLAYPAQSEQWRQHILRGTYRSLGWQLAEFCRMGRYTPSNTASHLRYQGLEHWTAAHAKGRGVLIVTAHLGAWELSSYYHSLMGHPMSMVVRPLDNPRLDAFVNGIRCRHGNRILRKDDFARGLLAAIRRGESVGILMDTNMTPPQGIFVPFFGHLACTAAGLARVAARTGAAVLPGFLLWHASERRYVLHFYPEIPMQVTENAELDALVNTARCTSAIETAIRAFPEQWLWVHRRWKTRPAGEPSLYAQPTTEGKPA